MDTYRLGCFILLFIQPLFATITHVNDFSNDVVECGCGSDTCRTIEICLQEVLTFKCSVSGSLLRWDGLDNSIPIPGNNAEFSTSNDIGSNATIGNFTFILVNITESGGVISNAEIATQNSAVVEGNGIRCRDFINGVTHIIDFTIVGGSSCSNVTCEEQSRIDSNVTVQWTWDGSQCATLYHVDGFINGTKNVSDITDASFYIWTVLAEYNTSVSITITPINLLNNNGSACSCMHMLFRSPPGEPAIVIQDDSGPLAAGLGSVIVVLLVIIAILVAVLCYGCYKYHGLKVQFTKMQESCNEHEQDISMKKVSSNKAELDG